MDYMTTAEASAKWGISDRRIRVLCAHGKIPGALKKGKTYQIPENARKPADARYRSGTGKRPPARYLKWNDDIVGEIHADDAVFFREPEFNDVVALYTGGKTAWSPEQFTEFLAERVVSRDRRDIERILFRLGLSHYDVQKIAESTRGIHPRDLLWIAHSADEKMNDVITDVFDSVFHQRIDMVGDSIDTPEGYNIKRYGVHRGRYGIYKQRISPLMTDVESEVAVYLLAEQLGIPCCPAEQVDEHTVFSTFLYNFSTEYIVHFRRLFSGARSDNEYRNLISVRPQYRDDIARMILLDFITRQDDRHLSNIAIKMSVGAESFYPLYDNGRSLFYEDTREMVRAAVEDPEAYATTFGYAGTYWDYVREIAEERGTVGDLLNLDISEADIGAVLREARFAGYRYDGAKEWILGAVERIRSLG